MNQTPILDKRSYSSPMSFVGATSRLWRLTDTEHTWTKITMATLLIFLIYPFVYTALAGWYVLIFGVFGVFVIPWRLQRRAERRADHINEAQLAALQGMK